MQTILHIENFWYEAKFTDLIIKYIERVHDCPKLISISLYNVCGPQDVGTSHRRDFLTRYKNIFYYN